MSVSQKCSSKSAPLSHFVCSLLCTERTAQNTHWWKQSLPNTIATQDIYNQIKIIQEHVKTKSQNLDIHTICYKYSHILFFFQIKQLIPFKLCDVLGYMMFYFEHLALICSPNRSISTAFTLTNHSEVQEYMPCSDWIKIWKHFQSCDTRDQSVYAYVLVWASTKTLIIELLGW